MLLEPGGVPRLWLCSVLPKHQQCPTLQTGTPEKLNAKPVTCTAWVRSSAEVDWPIFAVWTDPNKMLPKPVLVQAAYKLQWSNKDNSEASAQRNKDQELPISSVVGSNPPKEPYKKERSSRLMLLWLASCFLKARSSLCSWSQRTASLLKNYIFPSGTLISLSKHQDIVGDWDRPEEKSSYPVHLLRKFVSLWLLFSSHYHPQLFNFHRHCLLSRTWDKEAFPASLPRTTPSSGFIPRMPSSAQGKDKYPKVGAAQVTINTAYNEKT